MRPCHGLTLKDIMVKITLVISGRSVLDGKRKARVQLNAEEKKLMIKKIKLSASDENLRELTDTWNADRHIFN